MNQVYDRPATLNIVDKAERLVEQNRVIPVIQGSSYIVIGDTDTYVVSYTDRWLCNCQWGYWRPNDCACSHVMAAARVARLPYKTKATERLGKMINDLMNKYLKPY